MAKKKMVLSEVEKIAQQMDGLNLYLSNGGGLGDLTSVACLYDEKVGYFHVTKLWKGDSARDTILFRFFVDHNYQGGIDQDDQIMITAFPDIPDSVVGLTISETNSLGVGVERRKSGLTSDEEFLLFEYREQFQVVNAYLAAGKACGRLNSSAVVYDGKVGYFFVDSILVDGKKEDAIIFSYIESQIVITALPRVPQYWETQG